MSFELHMLPGGALRFKATDAPGLPLPPTLEKAFHHGISQGLFALGAQKTAENLPAPLLFWRQFACLYLRERCHTAADDTSPTPLASPPFDTLTALLENAPPMPGAEYLSVESLTAVWHALDDWLIAQLREQTITLGAYLQQHAPHWRQVGRVCFNLAENKQDERYPFAFMATYIAQLSGRGTSQHQPLGNALQAYSGAKHKKALLHLLSPLHLASESSALVKTLIESGDIYHPLAWTPAEAYAFLQEIPLYEQSGLLIRVPDWWHQRPKPQIKTRIGDTITGNFSSATLLDFSATLALGDQEVSPVEWKTLLKASEGLVFLKGRWVEIDKERLKSALKQWENLDKNYARQGISFIEGMRLLAGAPVDLAPAAVTTPAWQYATPGKALQPLLDSLRETDTAALRVLKPHLHAQLRPYQETGVVWLARMTQLNLGACLADDMGLGKTLQVISLLLWLKLQATTKNQSQGDKKNQRPPAAPSLLIIPTSLLGNWKAELEKFAPSLRCLFAHPAMMDMQTLGKGSAFKGNVVKEGNRLDKHDLVVTTYGTLLNYDVFQTQKWRLVILDEAQAIKNPASQQTRAVKKLQADSRIALTGTPIENRLGDLWSLFDFLLPGLLGSADKFKTFTKSLAARETDQFAPLRKLIQPYLLRRLKTDKRIIADLPEKTELNRYCLLSREQAALYEKSVHDLTIALRDSEGIQRRGLILSFLMRFKQICNHPSQLLGDDGYSPAASGKFTQLAALCEEIAARQEKALIFTQFREMTAPLAAFLAHSFGAPGLVLHGATSASQRQKLVDQFQREDGPPFFVLSLKAGGVGLNLTQASHVIHFDRWWNPAVENQATDRAFRIGQKRNVLVHKFICQGTLEEKIDALLTQKKHLANELLESGAEALLTEMSDAQLLDLVSLHIDHLSVDD